MWLDVREATSKTVKYITIQNLVHREITFMQGKGSLCREMTCLTMCGELCLHHIQPQFFQNGSPLKGNYPSTSREMGITFYRREMQCWLAIVA